MKVKHLESFGSDTHYHVLITLVEKDKNLWRKVANILGNLRRDLHPWDFVDKGNQRREAAKYVNRALKDTKLPEIVRNALKRGIRSEFGFDFEA